MGRRALDLAADLSGDLEERCQGALDASSTLALRARRRAVALHAGGSVASALDQLPSPGHQLGLGLLAERRPWLGAQLLGKNGPSARHPRDPRRACSLGWAADRPRVGPRGPPEACLAEQPMARAKARIRAGLTAANGRPAAAAATVISKPPVASSMTSSGLPRPIGPRAARAPADRGLPRSFRPSGAGAHPADPWRRRCRRAWAFPTRRRPPPALLDPGSPPSMAGMGGPSDCSGFPISRRTRRRTRTRVLPPEPMSGSRPRPASPCRARLATERSTPDRQRLGSAGSGALHPWTQALPLMPPRIDLLGVDRPRSGGR